MARKKKKMSLKDKFKYKLFRGADWVNQQYNLLPFEVAFKKGGKISKPRGWGKARYGK
jgi:hypothetical protein